jgi:hypothetical protein
VVTPGQTFLDWLHAADPTSRELKLENLQREPTVFLLRDCENYEEVRECLEEVCRQNFDEQLNGWYLVPSFWPSQRDMGRFNHWFEWNFHSVVVSATTRLSKKRFDPRVGFSSATRDLRFQFLGRCAITEMLSCGVRVLLPTLKRHVRTIVGVVIVRISLRRVDLAVGAGNGWAILRVNPDT